MRLQLSLFVISVNSKTLKILKMLGFLGVVTGSSGVGAEAVKALCKAYEEVDSVRRRCVGFKYCCGF
jgi:hypothetical protein